MPRLNLKHFVSFFRYMLRFYRQCNIPRSAAALSYFFILSFFPLLLCVNFFIGLLQLDAQILLDSLAHVLPQAALALMGDYIRYVSDNQTPALLMAGLITIVLSASAGLRVLLDTMDELYGRPRNNSLKRLILSLIFSALLLATVYLSLLVILTGDWFLQLLDRLLPDKTAALLNFTDLSGLWRWIRYLLLFCFVMLLVLAVYVIGTPRSAVSRRAVLVSSLASSLVLVAASALFAWMIGMSSRYALVYGSLASMIILLVWLYLCGNVLLLGAVFTRVWALHSRIS